ncbi:hypothetical protein D6779_09675 [Candidatus Parcubacteria bacterium]|nr:MAG: hypothetical protein D6779_09675 [Candidatus Parcubacteria bacterium]
MFSISASSLKRRKSK